MEDFRRTSEWFHIYETNSAYFCYALEEFSEDHQSDLSFFIKQTGLRSYISEQRVDEMHRACSDDLYRYATYHPVKHSGDVYDIAEPIRASYMIKWFLMFRPLFLDSILSFSTDSSTEAALKANMAEFFRKSNEILALYLATQIIRIGAKFIDGRCSIKFITEVMDGNGDIESSEVRDLLYSMRYRLPHQDVYRAFFRRLDGTP